MAKRSFKFALISLALFSFIGAGTPRPFESRIDHLLKLIAYVESRNNPLATSRLGARSGRGLYQVSEIAMEHVKWLSWPDLNAYRPSDLYDPVICHLFAHRYIGYLYKVYSDKDDPTSWVLSAYWQGIGATEAKGIAWGYVQAVLDAPVENSL